MELPESDFIPPQGTTGQQRNHSLTAPTHVVFAEFVYLLLLTTTGVLLSPVNALAVGISSLLADVDTGASYVGRLFSPLSRFLERRFGHRTLTHSLLFTFLSSLILFPVSFLSSDIYICLATGYLTHPLLDTMTVNGVRLFYPFANHRCVFPFDVNNPGRYRVQTGSRMDRALAVFFLIACIPVFYIAHQGYERFIRAAQQNIEAAVRDYNEFSRDNVVLADVTAYDMLTKRELKGRFEVVGALNPHTLVFKSADGRLHTLGKSFQADYVAQSVLCCRGERAYVTMQSIDLANQELSQLAALIDTSCENFLFGELATLEKVSLPPDTKAFTPVSASGSLLKLNYATLRDIENLCLDPIYVTKGTITVRATRISPVSPVPAPDVHPDPIVELSYTIEPRDTVILLRHQGDTLREGEVFAVKSVPGFFGQEMSLNDQKIDALRKKLAATLLDFDQRIGTAAAALRSDSADFAFALGLARKGFVSPSYPFRFEIRLRQARRNLNLLKSSRDNEMRKTNTEISKLLLSDSQLQAKAQLSRRQSEIRSPIRGILLETRRIPHDNRIRVIVFIRRLH